MARELQIHFFFNNETILFAKTVWYKKKLPHLSRKNIFATKKNIFDHCIFTIFGTQISSFAYSP